MTLPKRTPEQTAKLRARFSGPMGLVNVKNMTPRQKRIMNLYQEAAQGNWDKVKILDKEFNLFYP